MSESKLRPRPRIESLADLIFGLALSVGAVTLVGNVSSITTTAQLVNDIIIFGFSFLILISVWMRYTKVMSVFPLEDRWMLILNTALLFAVSLEPFLFNVFQLDSALSKDITSQAYAVDLGVILVILGCFTLVISRESRKLVPKDLSREFKIESATLIVAGALFFLSNLPIFWTPGPYGMYWRFYLWIIPFAISGIRRRSMSIIDEVNKLRDRREKA